MVHHQKPQGLAESLVCCVQHQAYNEGWKLIECLSILYFLYHTYLLNITLFQLSWLTGHLKNKTILYPHVNSKFIDLGNSQNPWLLKLPFHSGISWIAPQILGVSWNAWYEGLVIFELTEMILVDVEGWSIITTWRSSSLFSSLSTSCGREGVVSPSHTCVEVLLLITRPSANKVGVR